ncbi:MAG: hypothetical protein ACTSXV_01655 [Alphaproteobacteria bacterium]
MNKYLRHKLDSANMSFMKKIISVLSVFSSGGLVALFAHIFCCGIPALFSILGGGAIAGGLIAGGSEVSWIENFKTPLFIFGGMMILVSTWTQWAGRNSCPIDSNCARTKKWGKIILAFTVIIYAGSLYSAYFIHPVCRAGALPPLPI